MDKKEYRRAFDSVSAPEGAMNAVLARISPRPRRTVRKAAFILCAVLVLSCGAALATGVAGEWMDAIVRLNGQEVPKGNLQAIGQTAEANGIRMTLVSAASDGYFTNLLFDVESLRGLSLTSADEEGFSLKQTILGDEWMSVPQGTGWSSSWIRLDDGSDPTRAQLVLSCDSSQTLAGEELTLTIHALEKLFLNDERCVETEWKQEGPWEFRFTLNSDLEIFHYTMAEFRVYVSAIGVQIDGVHNAGFYWLEGAVLKMKDGTETMLHGAGLTTSTRSEKVTAQQYRAAIEELIDPSQAAAMVINGNEFPLIPVD